MAIKVEMEDVLQAAPTPASLILYQAIIHIPTELIPSGGCLNYRLDQQF